jgi:hypothetical protein
MDVERSDQSADWMEARAERRSRGHASTDGRLAALALRHQSADWMEA